MSQIKQIKKDFFDQKTSKSEFIITMHELHKVLFDFSSNLLNTEISKIEIEQNKVVFISREVNSHIGGIKFVVDELDPRITPVEAFNFNQYESQDSQFIFDNIVDGDIVFDIGTNIGWYSLHLAAKNQKSTIYSFEPIPNTFSQLKDNIELNSITNINLNNIALSNSDIPLEFFYNPKQTGASSSKNITGNEDLKKIECKSQLLDVFCVQNNITKIDFIKCDVEGAELFVFEGAIKTIEKYKPIVFTEILRKWSSVFDYHPNDIIQLFSTINYSCFVLTKDLKFKRIDKIDENTLETNFVFIDINKHISLLKKYS